MKFIRYLSNGDHFGEVALLNECSRTVSVQVNSETCRLLTLDREALIRILGQVDDLLKKEYDDRGSIEAHKFNKTQETSQGKHESKNST